MRGEGEREGEECGLICDNMIILGRKVWSQLENI